MILELVVKMEAGELEEKIFLEQVDPMEPKELTATSLELQEKKENKVPIVLWRVNIKYLNNSQLVICCASFLCRGRRH